MLTCEFGNALKRNVIDYHRFRASFRVHGEQNQSVRAARLHVVHDERYRWSLRWIEALVKEVEASGKSLNEISNLINGLSWINLFGTILRWPKIYFRGFEWENLKIRLNCWNNFQSSRTNSHKNCPNKLFRVSVNKNDKINPVCSDGVEWRVRSFCISIALHSSDDATTTVSITEKDFPSERTKRGKNHFQTHIKCQVSD